MGGICKLIEKNIDVIDVDWTNKNLLRAKYNNGGFVKRKIKAIMLMRMHAGLRIFIPPDVVSMFIYIPYMKHNF